MSPAVPRSNEGDPNEDVRRTISVVLRRVADCGIRTDAADAAELAGKLKEIEPDLPEMGADDLLRSAAGVIAALDNYSQRTIESVRRQRAKFKRLLSLLIGAIAELQVSSADEAGLEDLRRQLAQVNGIDDLENVETRLRSYILKLRPAASRTPGSDSGRDSGPGSVVNLDPVTRLPGRAAAEEAMAAAVNGPRKKYVAVVALAQLQSINARFGNAVGDRVLAALADQMKAEFWADDALYRWSGPALLALMERDVGINRLRTNLRSILGKPMDQQFDVGGREVLIPVSPAWTVYALIPLLAIILKHIDIFVAGQRPKDEG